MPSPNLLVSHVATNQNQPEITVNTAIDELDNSVNALLSVVLADANHTLSATEAGEALGHGVFVFTGALTADRSIILPAIKKQYLVSNQTTGGHNLVFQLAGTYDTGITLAASTNFIPLYCDGTVTNSLVGAAGTLAVALIPALPESKITNLVTDLAAKATVVGVPATAGAAGTAGQIAYNGSFLYVCIATNTWLRVAIATW